MQKSRIRMALRSPISSSMFSEKKRLIDPKRYFSVSFSSLIGIRWSPSARACCNVLELGNNRDKRAVIAPVFRARYREMMFQYDDVTHFASAKRLPAHVFA